MWKKKSRFDNDDGYDADNDVRVWDEWGPGSYSNRYEWMDMVDGK